MKTSTKRNLTMAVQLGIVAATLWAAGDPALASTADSAFSDITGGLDKLQTFMTSTAPKYIGTLGIGAMAGSTMIKQDSQLMKNCLLGGGAIGAMFGATSLVGLFGTGCLL